jgi:small subunit ribosomal protein S3
MGIEKKFVEEGLKRSQMNEYFNRELVRAGYGGMEINRTPIGTHITIYAEKPGMIIGKSGKTIRRVTRELDASFKLDNPQLDVQEIEIPELNAQIMAQRLANALERGWYFRKAGQSTLQRVMDAGALGCEVILAGKLTGPRSRSEKFLAGYIKHCGRPAEELVTRGYAVAKRKLGIIGVKVLIVPPGVKLPDDIRLVEEIVAEEVEPHGNLEEPRDTQDETG